MTHTVLLLAIALLAAPAVPASPPSDPRAAAREAMERLGDEDVDGARAALSPFLGGFLTTLVDTEGLMQGLDFELVARLRAATTRRLIVAGGVRHLDDVQRLERLGADAVAGMAIYTGAIPM